MSETLSVGELADAAGISRRAVRFYVARGLLAPAQGRGRGGHYGADHLEQVRRILALQQAGHSLEAIRQILAGGNVPPPPTLPTRIGRARPAIQAALWTRLSLGPGIELHFDTSRHQLTAEQILAIQQSVRIILGEDVKLPPGDGNSPAPPRRVK